MRQRMKTGFPAVIVVAMMAMMLFPGIALAQESSVIRLDEDGYLYYMDYTRDYYDSETIEVLRKQGFIDAGCSAFFTHNENGEPMTCRNYDYPHHVSHENRTITGLNIVLHCKPAGKYESIAMADAVWCDRFNPLLQRGGPDLAGFDVDMLRVLPYECTDGINEKGLCVSFFKVDIPEGDGHGRFAVAISMLVRYMLDDCANVSEAIEKVHSTIVTPEDWQDCHLLVTDSEGDHVVIESRNGEVSVIEADIATNFYLCANDIEDHYNVRAIYDDAVRIPDEKGELKFNPAYSKGYYHRFVAMAAQLERYQDRELDQRYTSMPESGAQIILQSVVQNQYTKSGSSVTQFSVIYNNAKKTLAVWPFQNYARAYRFDVTGTRLDAQ